MSVGAFVAGRADIVLEAILERADAALYRAKLNGRNRVERHEENFPSERSRLVRVA